MNTRDRSRPQTAAVGGEAPRRGPAGEQASPSPGARCPAAARCLGSAHLAAAATATAHGKRGHATVRGPRGQLAARQNFWRKHARSYAQRAHSQVRSVKIYPANHAYSVTAPKVGFSWLRFPSRLISTLLLQITLMAAALFAFL